MFMSSDLQENFEARLGEVVVDRLSRAERCLKLSELLMRPYMGKTPDEESLRAAIGRAYYSAHHSIRAMVLRIEGYDPDGHEESIKALGALLRDKKFRKRSKLSHQTARKISEAKDNRSVADYSPYDLSRKPDSEAWIFITDNDWRKAAQFNVRWAKKVFNGALKVV